MEEVDKGCLMIRMGVSGWMFLLVPAHPGSSGQRAVKWLYVCVCVYFFITVLFKTANWHGRWGEGRNYLLGICAIFVVQTCKYIALLYNQRPRTFTVECHELAEGCGVMLVVSSIFTTNVFTHGTIHFDKIKLPPLYSSTLTLNLVTVLNAHKM